MTEKEYLKKRSNFANSFASREIIEEAIQKLDIEYHELTKYTKSKNYKNNLDSIIDNLDEDDF